MLVIVGLFNNVLLLVLWPSSYCWGNPVANTKNEYFVKHNEFNTIFIGTSKTCNQADVATFDSLTDGRTKSFNFGVAGVCAQEILYFADNLIELNKNIKYAFVEIYDIDLIDLENLNTTTVKYHYNFDVWTFTVNSMWHSNFGFVNKLQSTGISSIAFVEWLFKFDMLKDVIAYNSSLGKEAGDLGINHTGFMPRSGEELNFPDQPESRREYLLDTASDRRMETATRRIFNSYKTLKFNAPYFNKLQALVSRLESKKVHVFLVMAPRINDAQLSNILPVFMKIDGCSKINLADPWTNHEFYEMQYSFDARHLNLTGSEIYTQRLAEAFNRVIQPPDSH